MKQLSTGATFATEFYNCKPKHSHTYDESLRVDRILPYIPWQIIDIHDDRALENIIRRSRIEDERVRRRYPVHTPTYDAPFIPPQKHKRAPELPRPRVYIDNP
ncbi:hypothetical protein HY772_04505 [Candidatus Woesearchaeota archaeon]|nr:hypothetical protein [Candidatus Woesearchaeota archaeon]